MGDITAAVFVRTCYPVVGNAVNLFPDVKYSVGLTLIFVGLDMILDAFDIDLPAWALGVLMPVLFVIGIASSMIRGGGTSKDLSKIMGEGCDYIDRKVSNEESGEVVVDSGKK